MMSLYPSAKTFPFLLLCCPCGLWDGALNFSCLFFPPIRCSGVLHPIENMSLLQKNEFICMQRNFFLISLFVCKEIVCCLIGICLISAMLLVLLGGGIHNVISWHGFYLF